MSKVYVSYNNICSALGLESYAVVDRIMAGEHGLQEIQSPEFPDGRTWASLLNSETVDTALGDYSPVAELTKLERMMVLSLKRTIAASGISPDERTGLIISTTKGNVDALDANSEHAPDKAYLPALGAALQAHFGFAQEPIIVSNACVSGILAIAMAKRLIASGSYARFYVVAGDLVSDFTLSGFASFQALSSEPCRPYCATRTGINLGEVACSALVTKQRQECSQEAVRILGAATANDANHISGPSRTGEGLFRAVSAAMKEAEVGPEEIGYLSAHGTATEFNDQMESIAFDRAGLSEVPSNSLKGYFGHTLGASGLLETIIGMHAMERNILIASAGFQKSGVPQPMAVIEKTRSHQYRRFLKTASGFGGVNTAVVFEKAGDE